MKITTIITGLFLAAERMSASPSSQKISTTKTMLPRRDFLREAMVIRAGQTDPYQSQQPNYASANSQSYENGFANYNPPPTGYDEQMEVGMMQESIQDRHDKWRQAQMEKYANLTPAQEMNPRDDQGRMKLMSSVSKGSRAVIFFVLMWRDLYLFEVADLAIKNGFRKMITRMFLTAVFLGNLAGVVTSVTSQGHATKNRLKAILNLDKVVETTLLVWNLARVTLFSSKYVPREVFVAGCMHSIFFLIQCQAFTRVGWDEKAAPSYQQTKEQHRQQSAYGQQHTTEYQTTLGDLEDNKFDSTGYPQGNYQNQATRSNPY